MNKFIKEEIKKFGEPIPNHLRYLRDLIMAPIQPLSKADKQIALKIAEKFKNGEYSLND